MTFEQRPEGDEGAIRVAFFGGETTEESRASPKALVYFECLMNSKEASG